MAESAFPTEIYLLVIEWVYLQSQDPYIWDLSDCQMSTTAAATLCACALTCKAWTSTSRAYLYRKIRITNETHKDTLSRFVASLDANPACRELVLELVIKRSVVRSSRKQYPTTDPSPFLHECVDNHSWHSWPALLAGKLPRLHTLVLDSGPVFSLRHACRSLLRAFTSVKRLVLRWDGAAPFSDIARWSVSFPRIHSLELWGGFDRAPHAEGQKRFQAPNPPQVRYLSYTSYHVGITTASAGGIYGIYAPSVEIIDWRYLSSFNDPPIGLAPVAEQISFCQLRILSLKYYWQLVLPKSGIMRELCEWLRSVHLPRLEHVVLQLAGVVFESEVNADFPDHSVNPLDDALHHYPTSISTLTIVLRYPSLLKPRGADFAKGFNALFPRAAKHGYLRIYARESGFSEADFAGGWFQAMPDGQIQPLDSPPVVIEEISLAHLGITKWSS
ncbi:hypothetical protein OH77DRAFT_1523378 [Trametes cingulata]|nr:hypothetical protein OH77DRAFT_1523378 [Trametes cingulata]